MLFKHVSIAGLAHIDAPHRLSSADINARLKPTMDRLGIKTDVLNDIAGVHSRRLWDADVQASDAATLAARKALLDAGIETSDVSNDGNPDADAGALDALDVMDASGPDVLDPAPQQGFCQPNAQPFPVRPEIDVPPTLPFLHVQGTDVVDESGTPVALRGVNFGSWLAIEGWLVGLPDLRTEHPHVRLEARRYLELLRPLGIEREAESGPPRFEIAIDAAARRWIATALAGAGLADGFAVINPGAGWDSKRWPTAPVAPRMPTGILLMLLVCRSGRRSAQRRPRPGSGAA